jgi:pterin-4a-carbinolamine dehydratase
VSLLSLLRENKAEKTFSDLKNFGDTLSGSNIVKYEDSLDLPIVTDKKGDWDILSDPERMRRKYEFDDMKEVLYFVNELYKYQFDLNHHCKILVDNLKVTVETYTHSFDGITDSDLKIKKYSDELYGDLN